jgi:shikimate O-hydroxycinnamoyltransferase
VTRPIPLSPIDHVFTGRGSYPLEFVFAYEREQDAARLLGSLRRALAHFPAVASRLVRDAGGGYCLLPSPDGFSFTEARSGETFASVASRTSFVDPVETVEGEPLARFRLTQTASGSVLGVSLSHAVVDGFSFFYFLSGWSRLHRGLPCPPPVDARETLAASGPAVPAPEDVEAFRLATGLVLDAPRPATERAALRWTRRVFAKAELKALLGEAQAACPVRLSHNDVVSAWLWRDHASAWIAPCEERAYLNCPVDVRRVVPGFPETYFGCAVAVAGVSTPAAGLREQPLHALARLVRDAVAAVDAERLRGSLAVLDALRRRDGVAAFERVHVVHPRAGLLVTNLSRLPVRQVEFDAGPPAAFDILAPAERCAIVLPAEDGLDVRICEPHAGA